jgi:hypothetical protein
MLSKTPRINGLLSSTKLVPNLVKDWGAPSIYTGSSYFKKHNHLS